ncbi:MAG: hypothetical protein RL154_225 [Pseudomonadota bacterium]
MLDSIANSFKSTINKIRFSDDNKALDRALGELKKSLLNADVHFKVVKELLFRVEADTKQNGIGRQTFMDALQAALTEILTAPGNQGFVFAAKPPTIVLMAGLQGSGKTTTTAKLALYLKQRGKKVLVAACDLQRAAAVEQLKQLGAQIEVDVYFEENNSNAIEVAKNAKERATSGLYDCLLIDSAGRLAIDEALMNELEKVKNAVNPFEIFYVADSMSGQDAVKTATSFNEKLALSGVILSKFDGDSKGGVAIGIAHQVGIPLRFIGMGEKPADLEVFLPDRVVSRLMGAGDIEGLAEKVSTVIDEKKAKEVAKKIKKGQFNFNDFLEQIEQVKKLGNLQNLIGMIPGLSGLASQVKSVDLENSGELKRIKALVSSMTLKERENPELLNNSRKKRIAAGAGLGQVEANRVFKQFEAASKLAKKMTNTKDMAAFMGQLQAQQRR